MAENDAEVLKGLEELTDDSKPAEVAEQSQETDSEGEEADAKAESKPDPRTSKAIGRIQQEERRAKEAHSKRLQELRAAEGERAELERFASLKSMARSDPAAVLEALGLTQDDFDLAARKIYHRSPQAKKDPKADPVGVQLAEYQRRIDDLESRLESRYQAEMDERNVNSYLDSMVKIVSDEAPLVSAMLSRNPERTRAALRNMANRLAEQDGVVPDHDEVIEALEEMRKAELEELGVDVAALVKPKGKPKTGGSKTLTSEMGSPKTPRMVKDRDEEIADVRRAIESGQLDL